MPVVTTIDAPTDPKVQEAFAAAEAHFGHVPNLVKTLGSNPDMCSSITHFVIQALQEGRVSWAFKELVILKTLRAIGSYYSYGAHERLAADLGNDPDKIGDVANSLWETSEHFSEAERAVMELVTQIDEDANDVSNELWDRLRANWDNGQLLELTSLITTFINIGRVGDALGVSEPVLFTNR
jgi:alkylhydroperoxidase family enzyme